MEHLRAVTVDLPALCPEPRPFSDFRQQQKQESRNKEGGRSMNGEGERIVPRCSAACHLQGSSVPGWAAAFPCDVVAGGAILTLASLVTVVTVGALRTAVLATPAPETCCAVASPCDGVAQSPVFALAPAAAVGPPVITITGCRGRNERGHQRTDEGNGKLFKTSFPLLLMRMAW